MQLGSTLVDEKIEGEGDGQTRAILWKLRLGGEWTVPVVELVRGEPKATSLLLADKGRTSVADAAEALLAKGHRVIAVDPFYLGESAIGGRDFLFALMVATVGDRALGLQPRQLQAVAKWAQKQRGQPATSWLTDLARHWPPWSPRDSSPGQSASCGCTAATRA